MFKKFCSEDFDSLWRCYLKIPEYSYVEFEEERNNKERKQQQQQQQIEQKKIEPKEPPKYKKIQVLCKQISHLKNCDDPCNSEFCSDSTRKLFSHARGCTDKECIGEYKITWVKAEFCWGQIL